MDRRKLVYSILKEMDKGIEPRYTDYDADLQFFGEVVEMMQRKNLIENATVIRAGMGNPVKMTLLKHAKITFDGMEYLEQNNVWAKTYNTIKELRDWIK
ncbi:YjcQ family protein [Bacillus sp. 4A_MP3]|uniref:YjcQ family protein n=1 Tax=Bacillus TaxID=1386 RepID=UPI0013314539|nr:MULTISPECIES: YjcQ family protein [Bacillus amyloliquefaciens group]MDL0428702.1 YjcQ family protein [Bacillus amyloliquefaciens]NRF33756.1 hypothetical protein [Bacillus velezensis]